METFDAKLKELLIQRMKKRLEQGRSIGIYQIANTQTHYTPEQIIEEAEKGTPIGEEFLWAEKKLMDELKKRM